MRTLLLTMIALSLAGCTSEPTPTPLEQPDDEPAQGIMSQNPEPEVVETNIEWEDGLARGAWGCNPAAGCHFIPDASAYNAVHEQPLVAGNVTNGNLTLEWQPASQVTEEMWLGLRVYNPTCSDCPSRYWTEQSGTSPLRIDFSADMYVEEGDVLRVWVYGAMIEWDETTNTAVGFSDEQEFSVTGSVAVQHIQ